MLIRMHSTSVRIDASTHDESKRLAAEFDTTVWEHGDARGPGAPSGSHRALPAVSLTSTIRGFHSEIVIEPDATNGLRVASAAQCQHLRAVSPRRIVATRGNVGPVLLARIRETVGVILDIG